jgi:hypothetical protein
LIVEEDVEADRTLFYLFEGELGRADLGIADLRRLAFGFGYADVRFEFPLSHYHFGSSSGAGGEGGSGGAPLGNPEPVARLSVDDHAVDLFEVDDTSAFDLGITRYLATVRSTDYDVRAFWGSLDGSDGFETLRWARGGRRFRYEAELSPTRVRLAQGDEDELVVEHGELSGADYKVVDLYQHIVRREDATEIDALVRTSYPVETEYQAPGELIGSVWQGLCWARERALFARVEQVARRYHRDQDYGFAVIYKRRDFARVPGAAWEGSAPEGELPGYCDDYE